MATDVPATIVSEHSRETLAADRTLRGQQRVATRRWSPVAGVIWAIFAVGLVTFVAFARVPIAAGWRQGRSMTVLDIWSFFVSEVSLVAGPLVTPGLITALVLGLLAGSLVGLWLAMAVTNDDPPDRPA